MNLRRAKDTQRIQFSLILFVFAQNTDKFPFAANGKQTVYRQRSTGSQSRPHIAHLVRKPSSTLVFTRLLAGNTLEHKWSHSAPYHFSVVVWAVQATWGTCSCTVQQDLYVCLVWTAFTVSVVSLVCGHISDKLPMCLICTQLSSRSGTAPHHIGAVSFKLKCILGSICLALALHNVLFNV